MSFELIIYIKINYSENMGIRYVYNKNYDIIFVINKAKFMKKMVVFK